MRKLLVILFSVFIAFSLISCGGAEQEQYDDMTGKNVVLRGTWESQPVSFTDGFGESFYNEKIVLSFTDDELTIRKGSYISQAHGYSRNGITLTIEDPKYADSGMDFSMPFTLEFSGPQFSVSLSNLEFLQGTPKMTFTKISEEPTLSPSSEPPQVKHNMILHAEMKAQCEQAGNIQYYECIDCGRYFSDEAGKNELTAEEIAIPALGHAYPEDPVILVESTDCTVIGTRMYNCMNCGKSITENYYAPHDMKHVSATEADCENNGYDEHYKCNVCEKLFLDEEGKEETTLSELLNSRSTGHDYTKRTPYRPSMVTNNYATYRHSVVCANCDKYSRLENHVSNEDGSRCELCGQSASYTYDLTFRKDSGSMHYARVTGISNESTVKNVIIPPKYQFDFEEDVGFINSRAFAGTDIETIYIPNHSFLQVGSNVFDGCDSLTDVYVGYDPLIGVYWEDDWLGDAADHVTVHENVSLSEYKKLYYSGN